MPPGVATSTSPRSRCSMNCIVPPTSLRPSRLPSSPPPTGDLAWTASSAPSHPPTTAILSGGPATVSTSRGRCNPWSTLACTTSSPSSTPTAAATTAVPPVISCAGRLTASLARSYVSTATTIVRGPTTNIHSTSFANTSRFATSSPRLSSRLASLWGRRACPLSLVAISSGRNTTRQPPTTNTSTSPTRSLPLSSTPRLTSPPAPSGFLPAIGRMYGTAP
mmetsp:Transcript_56969/g.134107  ORF Transcript_56969/g.134107 Transcript_56969/m.134107 type:complete len:221 (+) Transcript_56969:313-975(+)